MRNATPSDVFNAVAGLTQQTLSYSDRRNRELAEIEFQYDMLQERRESQLFLQTLQQSGDDDDLMRKWEVFRNERRANAEKRTTGIRATAEYRRAMGNLLAQNEVDMEARVRGRQIELMQANGRATFIDNLELARRNNEGNPQGFINEAHVLIRTALKYNVIPYPESLKYKNDIYDSAINGEINRQVCSAFESGKTINDLEEIFAGIDLSSIRDFTISPIRNQDEKEYAETLRAKPSLTTEEADWLRQFEEDIRNDTEGYEEKQELLLRRNEGLLRAGRERARQVWNGYITGKQKENAAAVSATYGDALFAVTLGRPEARDMILNGIAQVRGFRNPYLSENDRTEYNERYNRLLKTLEEGTGGRASSIKDAAVAGKLKELLTEVQAGRGGRIGSIMELHQEIKGMLYDWAYESGLYGGTQGRFEAEHAHIFEQFFDYAKDAVHESPEALSAINMVKNYANSLNGSNPDNAMFMGRRYAGVTAHAMGELMSGLYDEIYSYDNRDPQRSGQVFLDNVTRRLGVITGETIRALNETNRTGDNALINVVEALENNEIMHTDNLGRLVTMPGPVDDPDRTRRQVRNAWNVLGQRIARAIGIDDPSRLVAHNREDAARYEREAAPEFQLDGGGNWYRLVVEGEGRNKRLVLESRNGRNGEWGNRRVLDSRDEDRNAGREFNEYQGERNARTESGNREANTLANAIELPMPPEYTGRPDDVMQRHEFINNYGVERYLQFARNYYLSNNRALPGVLR